MTDNTQTQAHRPKSRHACDLDDAVVRRAIAAARAGVTARDIKSRFGFSLRSITAVARDRGLL